MAKPPSGNDGEKTTGRDAKSRLLLDWYETEKRPLPWRENSDPYRVWLSEVMLQQTRVETVIPYYKRFLEAFPSVEALARAEEDEVQALWSGLGYYRRARMLAAAAREVVRAGGFPETARDWRRLPGVGFYTAAAVASIVFGEKTVALDGNIERVLSRIEAYPHNPKNAAGRRFLSRAAETWLDPTRPGDSNQSLMELGATVCLPRNPLCSLCPMSQFCKAMRAGAVDKYPFRAKAAQQETRSVLAVCVRRGARLLFFRRDRSATLLAGTWELPWVDGDRPNPARALASRYGGQWELGAALARLRHTITRHDLAVTVYEGAVEATGSICENGDSRWANLAELDDLPHSSLVRKVFLAAGA